MSMRQLVELQESQEVRSRELPMRIGSRELFARREGNGEVDVSDDSERESNERNGPLQKVSEKESDCTSYEHNTQQEDR